jgi:hypothetical protein
VLFLYSFKIIGRNGRFQMSKGKARVQNLGMQATIASQYGDWDFIYVASLDKDSLYNIGDRVTLADRREYTYAKSSGICYAGQGVETRATYVQTIDNIVTAAAIGVRKLTIDGGTHDALTKDQLKGGYIVCYTAADSPANKTTQFRGIIGNDAADANADFTVYLDGPLTSALSASDSAEVFYNPFSSLILSTDVGYTKFGVPATYVSAANMYFWVQTDGCCWCAAYSGLGLTKERAGYWAQNGTITTFTNLGAGDTTQYAGDVVMGDATGVGPLFALHSRI